MKKPWTHAELCLLEDQFPHLPTTLLAKRLKRTHGSVAAMAHRLQIKKTFFRLEEMGRENVANRSR